MKKILQLLTLATLLATSLSAHDPDYDPYRKNRKRIPAKVVSDQALLNTLLEAMRDAFSRGDRKEAQRLLYQHFGLGQLNN